MKKLLALSSLSLLFLTGCTVAEPTPASDNPVVEAPIQDDQNNYEVTEPQELVHIGIIQLMDHPALEAARAGFVYSIESQGFNVEWDYQNAQGDQSTLQTISQRFVNNNVDLVLAIATPSAQSIANETSTIPIVGTAITSYEVAGLVVSNEEPGYNVTGASDMQPIGAQLELMLYLLDGATNIGLLYSSNEPNSVLQAGIARDYLDSFGIANETITISNINDLQQVATALAERVDAIWIPTDNAIANGMALVYQISVDTMTPFFAAEGNMTMTGGIGTLSVDYFSLGQQSGVMAGYILRGEAEPSTMPIQFAAGFDYIINGHMAEQMGIIIPERLQAYVQ